MGFPDHHIHSAYLRFFLCTGLVLLLAICLPSHDGLATEPPTPSPLPSGDWDHVIITEKALIPSFAPLAEHRTGQGLNCRVISLQEMRRWTWQNNLRDAIRGFIAQANREWGTRYVLLGGDAEIIPVPLGFFESPQFSWDIPLDLYYAAPNGEWDLDGDGILGEIEDDDPDLTPVVALGRAPVSDRTEAQAFVDKVLAFETAESAGTHQVLLAAGVGTPFPWVPGMPVQFDFAWVMEEVAVILSGWEAISDIQLLYENWEEPPYGEPLFPASFLGALNAGHHRFMSLLIHGIADTWALGPDYLTVEDLDELTGMDHSLFMVPWAAQAADYREEGVLETMFNLPVGGCVGALAPSSMFYISPANWFAMNFWEVVASESGERIGDAYLETTVEMLEFYSTNSYALSTLQCLSIVGDPALLLLPEVVRGNSQSLNSAQTLFTSVSPNPFNPATEISFVLPGEPGKVFPTVVEIFDLAGRRLNRILEADLAPGTHSVRWQGQDESGKKVGSGLFFGRIQAGEHQTVVKLILVE